MKFLVFSFWENNYKWISAILTVIITFLCFLCYQNLADKNDSFYIATVYAFFLFIVGLFISKMSNNIAKKMLYNLPAYIMLKKLNHYIKKYYIEESVTLDDTYKAIVFFHKFSNRIKDVEDSTEVVNSGVSYIAEIGFEFKDSLKILEDSYLNLYNSVKLKIQNSINDYIREKDLQIKNKGGFFELELLSTNYEEWCEENLLCSENTEKEEAIEHTYDVIKKMEGEINKLYDKKQRILRKYKRYNKKVEKNINKMIDLYGKQLDYILNFEDILNIKIEKSIVSIKETVERELGEENSKYYEIKNIVENVSQQITIMEKNLVDELNIIVDYIENSN